MSKRTFTQSKPTLEAYSRGDLGSLWGDLRVEDRRELSVVGLTDPKFLEDACLLEGQMMFTIKYNGKVLAVFGRSTYPPEPDTAIIWLLAGKRSGRHWRYFVRNTNNILSLLGDGYMFFRNVKDFRNKKQIAWLRRLGFHFIEREEDFGGSGLPFIHFVRKVNP